MVNHDIDDFVQDISACFGFNPNRTEITNTKLLKKGDHIGWNRSYLIWHHAIVIDGYKKTGNFRVIHFTTGEGGSGKSKCQITEEDIDPTKQNGKLFRFNYSENITKQYTATKVVETARKQRTKCIPPKQINTGIQDKRNENTDDYGPDENTTIPHESANETREVATGPKKYNILLNNCEHFATFCKTGKHYCLQIKRALKKVLEFLLANVLNFGKPLITEIIERFISAYNAEIVGAIGIVCVEGVSFIYDFCQIYKTYTNPQFRMSRESFKEQVWGRFLEFYIGSICGGGGSFLGGWLIGMMIPISGAAFLGSIVFGAVGLALGKYVGSKTKWKGMELHFSV